MEVLFFFENSKNGNIACPRRCVGKIYSKIYGPNTLEIGHPIQNSYFISLPMYYLKLKW